MSSSKGLLYSLGRGHASTGLRNSWRHLLSTLLQRHTDPSTCIRLACDCHASPWVCFRFITLFCLTWKLHQTYTLIDRLARFNVINGADETASIRTLLAGSWPSNSFLLRDSHAVPFIVWRKLRTLKSRSVSSLKTLTLTIRLSCSKLHLLDARKAVLTGIFFRKGVVATLQCT